MAVTFGEFLREQIDRLHISNTKFAEMMDVSTQTIGKYLLHDYSKTTFYGKGKKRATVNDPDLAFVERLSRITHTDACYILSLIRPNAYFGGDASPTGRLLAKTFDRLPKEVQQSLYASVKFWIDQGESEGGET
jgi:hypothetical protein